ncbi:hypothetical protein [Propionicicella superfundia]|uniref:hypothetical protein n=1 Tax=Propionicicella superfundia TaxID=348582 RepID=UPI000402B1C6|nr:hypothetical protein [Propionicicella superfundia]
MSDALTSPTPEGDARGWGRPLVVVALLAWVAGIALTTRSALNGDVTYTLGGLRTAGLAGFAVQDIFVARPVAYRFFMAGLDGVRAVFVPVTGTFAGETIIRLSADLVVVAVCAVAFAGLRRHVGRRLAAVSAFAAATALTLAPPWHFLQPDWLGVVLSVLAVGAALWPRRWWLGALAGGLCVMAVVAVKLATAPWAAMALVVIFLLDRRRAVATAVSGGLLVGVWAGLMNVLLPWENIWLSDQVTLVQQSPLNRGLRLSDLTKLALHVVETAVVSPVVMTLPVSAAALVASRTSRRSRWWTAAAVVVLGALSVASGFGQGEGLMYHFVGAPVFAAILAGVAFVRVPRARMPLVLSAVVAGAAGLALMAMPADWRLDHRATAAAVCLGVALAGIVLVAFATRRGSPRRPLRLGAGAVPSLGAAVLCAVLAVSSMPTATYAYSVYDYQITVGAVRLRRAAAAEVRDAIGADTPVLYFTFGSVGYSIGNPTPCRYPSPQWLQRSVTIDAVTRMRSFADNLECLSSDTTAQYLIIDSTWFTLDQAPAIVRERVDELFDCSAEARLTFAWRSLVACPRR